MGGRWQGKAGSSARYVRVCSGRQAVVWWWWWRAAACRARPSPRASKWKMLPCVYVWCSRVKAAKAGSVKGVRQDAVG